MFIALASLLAVAALLAVALPVIEKLRQTNPVTSAEETLEELFAQRDAALQALRDLKFDHQVGKITDEDYGVFEGNLKQSAATALRRIDVWEAEADTAIEQLMEDEIAARRLALGGAGMACPHCGRPAATSDAFCAGCGRPLAVEAPRPSPQVGPACPHCGRPLASGDRFCAGCGQSVGAPVAAGR